MRENFVFFIKLCVFILILALFVFGIVMPQYATDYTAALADKYERLASVEEPKIILIGDSNVAFGFNSEMIQDAFDMPVVNFGLHGGLGVAFHSDIAKSQISEGDIVIIAPCSYHDELELGNPLLAWMAVENNLFMLRNMPVQAVTELVKAFPTYLKRALTRWTDNEGNLPLGEESPYRRCAFNLFGDYALTRSECTMVDGNYGAYFDSKELAEYVQDYWNDYNEFVESKGARLYMSCPPILELTLYNDSEKILADLQMQLETGLSFPTISKLTDYVYPLEYFYDTGFHLNDRGKAIRTKQLISDLSLYLQTVN